MNELLALNDFSGSKILRPGETIVVSSPYTTAKIDTVPSTTGTGVDVTGSGGSDKAPVLSTKYSENLEWPVEGQKKKH